METEIGRLNMVLTLARNANNYILVGVCARGFKNEIFAYFENETYPNVRQMQKALASRASNSDDPNPLPTFYVNIAEDEPTIQLLTYNPVSGISNEDTDLALNGLTSAQLYQIHEDYYLV